MSRAKSAQVHVLLIRAPDGRAWILGTPSQRGFTEAGALRAFYALNASLPRGWTLTTVEITPIDEVQGGDNVSTHAGRHTETAGRPAF